MKDVTVDFKVDNMVKIHWINMVNIHWINKKIEPHEIILRLAKTFWEFCQEIKTLVLTSYDVPSKRNKICMQILEMCLQSKIFPSN